MIALNCSPGMLTHDHIVAIATSTACTISSHKNSYAVTNANQIELINTAELMAKVMANQILATSTKPYWWHFKLFNFKLPVLNGVHFHDDL